METRLKCVCGGDNVKDEQEKLDAGAAAAAAAATMNVPNIWGRPTDRPTGTAACGASRQHTDVTINDVMHPTLSTRKKPQLMTPQMIKHSLQDCADSSTFMLAQWLLLLIDVGMRLLVVNGQAVGDVSYSQVPPWASIFLVA